MNPTKNGLWVGKKDLPFLEKAGKMPSQWQLGPLASDTGLSAILNSGKKIKYLSVLKARGLMCSSRPLMWSEYWLAFELIFNSKLQITQTTA